MLDLDVVEKFVCFYVVFLSLLARFESRFGVMLVFPESNDVGV